MAMIRLSLSQIEAPETKLRDVDVNSEAFLELTASIREKGLLNPFSVRQLDDGRYEVVDGLHRYVALCTIDPDQEIDVNLLELNDNEVLEAQIIGNLHRIETKPTQYARQLHRILLNNQDLTIEVLARRLGKSTGWLYDRLSLKKLEGRAAELVDTGQVKLVNAYGLAKLQAVAPEEVEDWVDRAATQPPHEFGPEIQARVMEIKKAQRAGRKASKPTGPALKLRKLGDIKAEYLRMQGVVAAASASDHDKGYASALAWVLQQDPETIDAWRRAQEERERQKAERKAERAAQKAAEKKEVTLNDLLGIK